MYNHDKRIVVTLDAGGTHFRFNAIQGNKSIVQTIELPSDAHNLDKCLGNLTAGFEQVINALSEKPVAISFAFPGPADYPTGIFPTRLSRMAWRSDLSSNANSVCPSSSTTTPISSHTAKHWLAHYPTSIRGFVKPAASNNTTTSSASSSAPDSASALPHTTTCI